MFLIIFVDSEIMNIALFFAQKNLQKSILNYYILTIQNSEFSHSLDFEPSGNSLILRLLLYFPIILGDSWDDFGKKIQIRQYDSK